MGVYKQGPTTAGRRLLFIFLAVALFAALLFWGKSWGWLAGWTPLLLILLLCPFVHMFMHRGQSAHGGTDDDEQPAKGSVEGGHRH